VRDNGGGQIISTELVEAKAAQARRNLEAAGLSDLVEIRVGDALETLTTGFGGRIDLAHLDGAPSLYFPVFKLVESHLRPSAFVIAENAYDQVPEYLEYVRDPRNGCHSTRIQVGEGEGNEGRGNELTVVLGRS
jgi:predicted O-methyltransferase YrrM